jgi:hypothetical protein
MAAETRTAYRLGETRTMALATHDAWVLVLLDLYRLRCRARPEEGPTYAGLERAVRDEEADLRARRRRDSRVRGRRHDVRACPSRCAAVGRERAGRGRHIVPVPPLAAAKLALCEAMRRQEISNAELARRLGITEAVVRRLVDPDHASRIERVQAALAALGVELVVEEAA